MEAIIWAYVIIGIAAFFSCRKEGASNAAKARCYLLFPAHAIILGCLFFWIGIAAEVRESFLDATHWLADDPDNPTPRRR